MVIGLLLILLSAIMNAAFPVPMRHIHKWAWENTWLVWSAVALLMGPCLLAWATVPDLPSVYAAAGFSVLALAFLFGMLWGIAGFLFGLSVEMVGMSLTFAVVNGVSSAVGSWVPLAVLHPGKLFTGGGIILSAGLLTVICGVFICARAGSIRSNESGRECSRAVDSPGQTKFARGLIVCISCALLAPCFNLGFSFGQPIATAAARLGCPQATSTNAVLTVVLCGGFVMNVAYCVFRLTKHRTWALFAISQWKKYLLLGTTMGLLWIVSYAIYGSATTYLGSYGTVIGWPILMAVMTMAAGLMDAAYGDWKGRPLRLMALGVLVLCAAVVLISYAMFRLQHSV